MGAPQATGPGAEDRAAAQRALRSSAAAVAACVSYLAHAARAAADAAARLQRLQPQGQPQGQSAAAGPVVAAASAEVLRAERAVADCCALLLSVVGEPAALAKLAAGTASQQQAAGKGYCTSCATSARMPVSEASTACQPLPCVHMTLLCGNSSASSVCRCSSRCVAPRLGRPPSLAVGPDPWVGRRTVRTQLESSGH